MSQAAPATRPRRRSVALPLAAAALLAVAAGFLVWSNSVERTLGRLEHEETSAYSRIRIRRAGDVRVMTFLRDNGQEAVQSRVDVTAPETLLSPYARSMLAAYLYQPSPRRVLVVGLGGGAMVRFLAHHQPELRIDAVEIDPVVVRLADQYFGVRSGGLVNIVTADAVAYITATEERYDVILMDAFLRPSDATDATGVPSTLKTVEFLGHVRRTLAPGGVVAFNLNEHAGMADDIAAITAAFGPVAVFRAPPADNQVVVAAAGALPGQADPGAGVAALDARFGGALSFGDILANRN